MLLLCRQGGRVVNDVWMGSAGGQSEEFTLNDARACVLRELQEEPGITADNIGGVYRTAGILREEWVNGKQGDVCLYIPLLIHTEKLKLSFSE